MAGSVVLPTGVVLFSGLAAGSAVLLSLPGLVVDALAVVSAVPWVALRSAGVMIVVVSMSSVGGPEAVPADVVLFSALLVTSTVLLSVAGLVVDVLTVVRIVP